MKDETLNSESLFRLDCFLALHQRLCWAAAAAVTLLGAVLIVGLIPREAGLYVIFVFGLMVVGVYAWASRAPGRALRQWMLRCRGGGKARWEEGLSYLQRLEKALPAMKKREMLFDLTCTQAVLLDALDREEAALSLLKGFDKIWDPAQRETISALIHRIEGKSENEGKSRENR